MSARSLLLATSVLVSTAAACQQEPPPVVPTPPQPTTAPPPPPPPPVHAAFDYPPAHKGDVVDDYHGTKVADPYRRLEDPDAPETRTWIAAEDKLTFDYLGKIPGRAQILERVTKLYNFEKYTQPFKEGGKYFWTHNDGLQNQYVLYWGKKANDPGTVLLDPNKLSADGTVALSGLSVSRDGKHLAYALSKAGSDWQEWYVREIETGKDLPDHLKWAKFSGASFTKDGKGFYYSRFPEPPAGKALEESNYNSKIYYPRLGETQDKDQLIYERPDHKDWMVGGSVTEDGQYLIVSISRSTSPENLLFFQDLRKKGSAITPIVDTWEALYAPFAHEGPVFYVQTNKDAPNGKAIAIDLRHPEPANWKPFLDESPDKLEDLSRVGDRFFFTYLHDAHSRVMTRDGYDPKAPMHEVELPGIGSAAGFGGHREDTETFWSYTSFTEPDIIYHYDLKTGKSTVLRRVKTDFDPSLYETKQVFYASKDGTKIPMFLVYKKGLVLDGHNPTVLYGYGGFDYSQTPAYRSSLSMWMDLGGVYAVPNLRGGGEYGEAWHLAGTKAKKQNVFDDFIAAAEWLIANKYTSTPKLAINGGSNGGLLIGAVETQRPDLFGACVADVGVMDMLRYQKFTIGYAWADDFGTADDPALFPVLYKYSPLHNVHAGTKYPPTLITTSDHDDRVVPAHSFKFAATMQAAQASDAPILIRIETEAGHGGGLPTQKALEESADHWAFIAKTLGAKMPAPSADTK